MFGLGKKKKAQPAADFTAVVGQAAKTDKKLYQGWANYVRSQGGTVSARLAEFMAADLEQVGLAPNPGGPVGSQGGAVLTKDEADAIKRANKDIDDAYTSAEMAKEFGEKLRELTSDHIKQIKEISTTISQITTDVLQMQNQFRNAPDFKGWSSRLDSIIAQETDILGKQDAIIGKTGELINAVNKSIEKMGELVKEVREPIVGELQRYFDLKLGKDGLSDIRESLAGLIKANNSLVEAYGGKFPPKREVK